MHARWPVLPCGPALDVNEKNNRKSKKAPQGFPDPPADRDHFFRFSCFFQSGKQHPAGLDSFVLSHQGERT